MTAIYGNLALKESKYDISEIIDGREVMMSPATVGHNATAGNIFFEFRKYLKGKTCRAFGDNTLVKLDEDNQFVPDTMILCDRSKAKGTHIEGAPDLVVEVLSPSTAHIDRRDKLQAYGRFGVKEYWIVSVKERSVEVYLQVMIDGDAAGRMELDSVYSMYDDAGVETDEVIKVSFYDDLYVSLADIFDDVD